MKNDITPIALADATDPQALAYARDFLNLDLVGNETPEEVTAKIRAAQPNVETIFYATAAAEQAASTASGVPEPQTIAPPPVPAGGLPDPQWDHLGKGDPRCLLMIASMPSEDGSGDRDVEVGVNGRFWQLKRGVNLNVPLRVSRALDLAIQTSYTHETNSLNESSVLERKSNRFPVSKLEMPTAEVQAAWDQRMVKVVLGGDIAATPPQPAFADA